MNKLNIIKFLCVGGMLTALAVLFQAAPVFLPALGLLLSPLSTLPIAIAAVSSVSLGLSVLFSSALILTIISVQEAIILIFSTGLLGIVIGALLYKKGILISTVFSSISLALGIVFLTYIIGIPTFLDFASSLSTSLTLIIFVLFSLVYASIWNFCLRKFANYLKKIKVIR